MFKRLAVPLLTGWLAIGAVQAQSTIAYFNGPSFTVPLSDEQLFDIDADGTADFSFGNGGAICTTDVPVSACTYSYPITSLLANEVLAFHQDAVRQTNGTWIGPVAPANSGWLTATNGATISRYTINFRSGTGTGTIWFAGYDYLGVRFHFADGLHYGWVRLNTIVGIVYSFPEVLDWAFETRVNTPIRAGAKPVLVPLQIQPSLRTNYFRVSWLSVPEKAYQVQFKAKIEAPVWSNLDFNLVGSSTNSIVDLPISGRAGFYRVVEAD